MLALEEDELAVRGEHVSERLLHPSSGPRAGGRGCRGASSPRARGGDELDFPSGKRQLEGLPDDLPQRGSFPHLLPLRPCDDNEYAALLDEVVPIGLQDRFQSAPGGDVGQGAADRAFHVLAYGHVDAGLLGQQSDHLRQVHFAHVHALELRVQAARGAGLDNAVTCIHSRRRGFLGQSGHTKRQSPEQQHEHARLAGKPFPPHSVPFTSKDPKLPHRPGCSGASLCST